MLRKHDATSWYIQFACKPSANRVFRASAGDATAAGANRDAYGYFAATHQCPRGNEIRQVHAGNCSDSVSVALEEIEPAEGAGKVYRADILRKAATLYKKPGPGQITLA